LSACRDINITRLSDHTACFTVATETINTEACRETARRRVYHLTVLHTTGTHLCLSLIPEVRQHGTVRKWLIVFIFTRSLFTSKQVPSCSSLRLVFRSMPFQKQSLQTPHATSVRDASWVVCWSSTRLGWSRKLISASCHQLSQPECQHDGT